MPNRILTALGVFAVLVVAALVALAITPLTSSAQPGGPAWCARHPQNPHCRTPSPTPTSTHTTPPSTTSIPPSTNPPPTITTSLPPPTSPPVSTSPPPPLQPVGDPLGRVWTPVMSDEFNGTSIDRSKWAPLSTWRNNNVLSQPKNCIENGSGTLILALPGDGTGCDLYSGKSEGAGANAHDLQVGEYLEARIFFPGPGSAPTSQLYNWPAFWTFDEVAGQTAGENDIAEALNHMEYNYSATGGSDGTFSPSGLWGNSWHVYGIYRSATQVLVFYDGVRIYTQATHDNGGPESIMFTSGYTDACCGAPTAYSPTGNVLVDWVRDWH
jgi:hypothetical protein